MIFQNQEILVQVEVKRVVLRFKAGAPGLMNFVALLPRRLQEFNESFMKGRLRPVLFMSSNGTQDESACVRFSHLAKPMIESFPARDKTPVHFSQFLHFVDGTTFVEVQESLKELDGLLS